MTEKTTDTNDLAKQIESMSTEDRVALETMIWGEIKQTKVTEHLKIIREQARAHLDALKQANVFGDHLCAITRAGEPIPPDFLRVRAAMNNMGVLLYSNLVDIGKFMFHGLPILAKMITVAEFCEAIGADAVAAEQALGKRESQSEDLDDFSWLLLEGNIDGDMDHPGPLVMSMIMAMSAIPEKVAGEGVEQ